MKRSGFAVMARLVGLVRPLAGYMALAVTMGLIGHLCATFLTVLGGYGILGVLGAGSALPLAGLAVAAAVLAVLRAALRYGEQACNHFIAFKLLALLRDKVFRALRRLAPAKLEGREKGDLIAVITSDIELLEVFYAHTISPVLIAVLFSTILTAFIGSFHPLLGALALTAYAVVGIGVPLAVSRASGPDGLRLRNEAGALAGFVLDSLRGLPEILQYGAGAGRPDHRHCGQIGQRQIHPAQAVSAVLAGGAGPGAAVGPQRGGHQHEKSAPDAGPRHPGDPSLPGFYPQQPAHRQAGRHRRPAGGGLQKSVGPRLHRGAAPGL